MKPEGEVRLGGKTFYDSQSHHSFELGSLIIIRKDFLYHNVMPAFVLAWVLAVSVMLASIAVISYNSGRITKPLQTMVGKLGEVGRGDFEAREMAGNADFMRFLTNQRELK